MWQTVILLGDGVAWERLFKSNVPRVIIYRNYLQSQWWSHQRQLRLAIDGNECVKCRTSDKLQAHHLTYDRIGNENIETDLITLCEWCHKDQHGRETEATGMRLAGSVIPEIPLATYAAVPESVRAEFRNRKP